VDYGGVAAGKGIAGRWRIEGIDGGSFRIWPSSGDGDGERLVEEASVPVARERRLAGLGSGSG
jgi:hypothetical protein